MGYYKALEVRLSEPQAREPNGGPIRDSRIAWPLLPSKATGNHEGIPSIPCREAMEGPLKSFTRASEPRTAPRSTRGWRTRIRRRTGRYSQASEKQAEV
jgi:transposase